MRTESPGSCAFERSPPASVDLAPNRYCALKSTSITNFTQNPKQLNSYYYGHSDSSASYPIPVPSKSWSFAPCVWRICDNMPYETQSKPHSTLMARLIRRDFDIRWRYPPKQSPMTGATLGRTPTPPPGVQSRWLSRPVRCLVVSLVKSK